MRNLGPGPTRSAEGSFLTSQAQVLVPSLPPTGVCHDPGDVTEAPRAGLLGLRVGAAGRGPGCARRGRSPGPRGPRSVLLPCEARSGKETQDRTWQKGRLRFLWGQYSEYLPRPSKLGALPARPSGSLRRRRRMLGEDSQASGWPRRRGNASANCAPAGKAAARAQGPRAWVFRLRKSDLTLGSGSTMVDALSCWCHLDWRVAN